MNIPRLLPAVLASVLLQLGFVGLQTSAFAESYDTIIENKGSHSVVEVYVITTILRLLAGDSAFKENVLEHDLGPGATLTLHTDPTRNQKLTKSQVCQSALKFVYPDGHVDYISNVNLCETAHVTLEY